MKIIQLLQITPTTPGSSPCLWMLLQVWDVKNKMNWIIIRDRGRAVIVCVITQLMKAGPTKLITAALLHCCALFLFFQFSVIALAGRCEWILNEIDHKHYLSSAFGVDTHANAQFIIIIIMQSLLLWWEI